MNFKLSCNLLKLDKFFYFYFLEAFSTVICFQFALLQFHKLKMEELTQQWEMQLRILLENRLPTCAMTTLMPAVRI